MGASLSCEREPYNHEDLYAVATKICDTIVGHVPCTASCIFDTFLCHGGSIICTITGDRRSSLDLPPLMVGAGAPLHLHISRRQ